MKRIWMLVLLLSLGLNLGLGVRLMRTPANFQDKPEGGWRANGGSRWERPAPGDSTAWRGFMGRRLEHLAARLDLRPDQVEHFRQAQRTTFWLMREHRSSLLEARSHLRELLTADKINHQAVRRAMAELGRRQAEVDSLTAETVLGELEVLDPAQRVQYLDFLPEGPGHRPGRGHYRR